MPLTHAEMTEDIDEDGTTDSLCMGDTHDGMSIGVETYYCPLEGIAARYTNDGDGFLLIDGDNRGTNVQIRVPFADMIGAGWTPPPVPEFDEDDRP